MPILNYTTTIDSEKTCREIQKMLSKAGANAVMTEYDKDQVLSSIAFRLDLPGGPISFRLPARIDNIYVILQREADRPKYRTREQAARVAWRIIKDWIQAQLALVEAEQVDMVEVFLPYAQTAEGGTIYQRLTSGTGMPGVLPQLAPPEG